MTNGHRSDLLARTVTSFTSRFHAQPANRSHPAYHAHYGQDAKPWLLNTRIGGGKLGRIEPNLMNDLADIRCDALDCHRRLLINHHTSWDSLQVTSSSRPAFTVCAMEESTGIKDFALVRRAKRALYSSITTIKLDSGHRAWNGCRNCRRSQWRRCIGSNRTHTGEYQAWI